MRYHNFEGIVINEAEKKRIVEDLGPTKKVILSYIGYIRGIVVLIYLIDSYLQQPRTCHVRQ